MIQQTDPSTILLAKTVGAAWWKWDVANNQFSFDSELPKILGVTKDIDTTDGPLELLLKNCHSEDVDIIRNSINTSANKGSILDVEFRLTTSSGLRYVRCLASAVSVSEARTLELRGYIYEDKSRTLEEKMVLQQEQLLEQQAEQLEAMNKQYNQALDEQKQMFEELVDIVPVMINSFDAEGNCLIWNKSCEKVLGYSFEDAQTDSQLMEKFYPDPELHEKVLKAISNPDGQFRQYPVIIRDGSMRTQLWSNFLLKNKSMIGCGVDITELKDAENQLKMTNKELEQFAYIASHDLKEPVRTLNTFSNYLIEDLKANNEERIAEDVKYINSASRRMTKLIDDLLEFSRAGNSPLKKSKLSLANIVKNVQENLRAQIQDSSAMIKTELHTDSIWGDSSLFGLVIQNLLQNAIKFQPKGQKPEITISSKADSLAKSIEINLVDNGIGIDKEQQESIFGVFKKLHASSEYEGTGIGLAIVHKIIQRHGGTIEVVPELTEGSCFKIRLPIFN